MNGALPDYLTVTADRPFEVGSCDCVLWCCDWVARVSGRDPAAPWRGAYRTARAARRLVRRAGGLAPLVAGGMARAGYRQTDDPLPGDVAVVSLPQGDLMAIRTRLGWAVKSAGAVAVVAARVVVAWRVEPA